MPSLVRVLAAAVALLALSLTAPVAAPASFDLTHGQRFGNAPNEIVDVSSDGRFLVATQGKGVVKYDLANLATPVQSAILADLGAADDVVLGNGTASGPEFTTPAGPPSFGVPIVNSEPGPTSVALVRDEYVIVPYNATNNNVDGGTVGVIDPGDLVPDPVDGIVVLDADDLTPVRTILFDDDDPVTGIDGAPTGTPGSANLLEVPDSVAVSPDGTRAVIAIENDRELGQPITVANPTPGGVPGFVRADTSDPDPLDWTFDFIALPQILGPGEGELEQPEFVDVRGDNTAVGSLQEANRIAVFDLDTVGPALGASQIHDVGSSTFLADTVNDNPVSFSFTTSITRRRQPDTVKWVADGTLVALANEGENGAIGGTRDFSIHAPDGAVVSKVGSAFEPAVADYGFLGDGRNTLTNKGSEPEGMDAVTVDGSEYLLVLGERSESLSTWDITFPAVPRLVSHVPTGEAPEGIKANAERGIAVVANEEVANMQGNIGFFTLHRFTDSSLLPADRLIPRGNGTPYFNVRGLGAGLSPDRFATVDATVPTRVLEVEVGGRGYAPLRSIVPVGGIGAMNVIQDVAPAPGGGWWVVGTVNTTFELARLGSDGSILNTFNVPDDQQPSGVVVTPDGGTVYVSVGGPGPTAGRRLHRFDVETGVFTSIEDAIPVAGADRILDLALAGDGDLLAVEANPNNEISLATIARFDNPAAATSFTDADRTVLATIPVAASRSGTDMTGLALRPGGELWGVSGTRDGGDHIGHADLRRLIELPAPILRTRPALTGTAVVGQTLACGNGTWTGASSFTREWRRDGEAIPAATAATYGLTAADQGQRIVCAVLAAGPDAFEVAESNAVFPVPAAQQGPTGPTGGTGATGPVGPAGGSGPQGPTGGTGPAGPAGADGAKGDAGAPGARGPVGTRGPAGRDARVVCASKKGKPVCRVQRASRRAARARVMRGGKLVRRGRVTRTGRLLLRGGDLPPGRYTLVLGAGGEVSRLSMRLS